MGDIADWLLACQKGLYFMELYMFILNNITSQRIETRNLSWIIPFTSVGHTSVPLSFLELFRDKCEEYLSFHQENNFSLIRCEIPLQLYFYFKNLLCTSIWYDSGYII
jgi:hypothetical protein